jgi:hypothetical protein
MKLAKIILVPLFLILAFAIASAAPEAAYEPLKSGDLSAWRKPTGQWRIAGQAVMDPADPRQLRIEDGVGILANGPKGGTSDLFTAREFGDVEVHVEFMIPSRSNSGIYLMGRYEVQIYDSFGVAKDEYPGIECGGIYPRWIDNHNVGGHSPRVNASRPSGQWQTFDVTFRAPRFGRDGKKTADAAFVKVVHNGKVIHQNVAVTGPTRSAAFDDERPAGPLMLQGDHGPVAFRNIRIRPIETSGATTNPSSAK